MSRTKSPSTKPLTKSDLGRIQSAVAIKHNGGVPKGSYVTDMQRVIAKRGNPGKS